MTPLLLFLAGCAAIFVGTVQAAFSALLRLSLRLLAERNGRADRLGKYLDDPILLFVPARLLLGLLFAVATVLVARIVGETTVRSLAVVLVSMTAFILVCEEVVPLLIVRRDPERVMNVLLPVFEVFAHVLQPVTRPLVRLLKHRDRPASLDAVEARPEGEAAEAYLEVGEQQGLIEGEERRLLQSIFDFGDTLVREVMTPRPDIVALHAGASLDELRALFREQEYSRIPVYGENLDTIVGIVVVKDLIGETDSAKAGIEHLIRPAYFVPETKRVAELLKEFQLKQVQLAIVVDEYGGTAGLVTLEDLLEEIVGEIRDEYDVESERVVDEGNGAYVFSAKVDIDEVTERLGVPIEREGFETVGGYLLSRIGRVPAVGESFEVDGLAVKVLEAERRRIHKVRMQRQGSLVPSASPHA
ncbi:MAG: HlyC/CorC family transporter [Acidobacteria bacterium]|nr:HlyC/CorC family transporter [Acidobacteriota bacterium]